MSRENNEVEALTAEQSARISQKFRAAKALLSRKRHRSSISSTPQVVCGNIPSPQSDASIVKRIPLSEIFINTLPALPSWGSKQTYFEDGVTHSKVPVINTIGSTSQTPNQGMFSVVRCDLDDPSITPSKERDGGFTSSDDGPPSLNVLDDDFDYSLLEEIDAFCDHKLSHSKADIVFLAPDAGHIDSNSGSVHITNNINDRNFTPREDSFQFIPQVLGSSSVAKSMNIPQQYSKYLASLNERQREAAFSDITTPLMIAAGPGSGKTSTMVGRILVLLSEGIDPSNILAMTFTTAAASEMRERISTVAGKMAAKDLNICTFHSFSLQLCRSHADKLGRTHEFSVFGQGQQRRAVIEAMRLLGNETSGQNNELCKLEEDPITIASTHYCKDKSKKWQKFVTQAKASGKTPGYFTRMGNDIGAAILKHYNETLTTCNSLDYHDLISCSVKLLSDFPEVLKECQNLWKAIIVDEFQDTSSMQYKLLQILASHDHITIVGDDDQSIFSFNGADTSGFDSFREDFPNYKEIRLNKNYRSTRCIVEAAASLIQNNVKRCQLKDVLTDNSLGSKITIKECHNEDAQCMFVIDKILEAISGEPPETASFGNFAILYRRQVSGKVFQAAFRDRKIPFNIHGVAFYRKKVVRVIFSMLNTTLTGCDDGHYRRVFKGLLPLSKEEKKMVVNHIDKISTIRKCSFLTAAFDIFNAKISGTFKRSQLTQGRKLLSTLDMIKDIVQREQSLSTVITSVANMIPQRFLLEQRAIVDNDGGKFLNEDSDLRSVIQYLLDDVASFISIHSATEEYGHEKEERGCLNILKAFIDFISEREKRNFRSRINDNENSVALTTIHQSKGLEWDIVFIVKANESEIPLIHEFTGVPKEDGSSLEEERRLFYVAMTRARKKLFILYVTVDSTWQILQPSRFFKEIPVELLDFQISTGTLKNPANKQCITEEARPDECYVNHTNMSVKDASIMVETSNGNNFLKR
ncbi:hypothetical protein SAY87_017449 [Trapa incisa]|uniref:DNA 3'-5' helicase n=1 Tax=Trapa incisa TaxID=236973 RepID=A0AAN7LA90_9MYRT|nr:hypothetical protein SAY87_017449 [Trapa incisa]